jgi:hypothetical protein
MAVQSFIVQTHVHAPGPVVARAAISQGAVLNLVAAALPDDARLVPGRPHVPIDEDQNCPLCQQFHSAGQFFAPTAALFVLPAFVNIRMVALDVAAVTEHQPSHDWRGRAPPQA